MREEVGGSDIDDHHAALGFLSRRCDRGAWTGIAFTFHRELGSTPFTLTASFLFFLEDLFDNPGIQHVGPPFMGTGWSSLTSAKY